MFFLSYKYVLVHFRNVIFFTIIIQWLKEDFTMNLILQSVS